MEAQPCCLLMPRRLLEKLLHSYLVILAGALLAASTTKVTNSLSVAMGMAIVHLITGLR